MVNKEYLRNKVKYHIRDIHMLDPDLDAMIETIVDEISVETNIFRKLFGFTVHDDIVSYNFKGIARLNERTELEPVDIIIGDPTPEDMINFINTGEFPDPVVTKTVVTEAARARLFNVIDIFDLKGNSVLDRFEDRGSSYYFCFNDEWRKIHDNESFIFTGSVSPEIDELTDDMLMEIAPCVIAGAKFYVNDTMHSPDDTQATNYDYMRWFQAKEKLGNLFPTTVYSIQEDKRWQ